MNPMVDWILRGLLVIGALTGGFLLWLMASVWTLPLIAITGGCMVALLGLFMFDRADDRATETITAAVARSRLEIAALNDEFQKQRIEWQDTLKIELSPFERRRQPNGAFAPDPPEVLEARRAARQAKRKLREAVKVIDAIMAKSPPANEIQTTDAPFTE